MTNSASMPAVRIPAHWPIANDAEPWDIYERKFGQWQNGMLDAESIQVATDPDWVEWLTNMGVVANG